MNFLLILAILLAPASLHTSKQLIPSDTYDKSSPVYISPPALRSVFPDAMEFVTIPSGTFMMGSPWSEEGRGGDEGPGHSVNVSSFGLMTTEVTQGMWEVVMGESASSHHEMSKGSGNNYPMYYVSWYDCQEFINELNSIDTEHIYRLPSESEWEYACRAGTTTRFYWGNSDSESTMKQYCWYEKNADDGYWTTPHASQEGTQPVGKKIPNAWGLYDMNGNVCEWCEDTWHNSYDGAPIDGSAWVSSGAYSRVERGGSWYGGAGGCRSACRIYGFSAGQTNTYLGFRLARSVL
ncbi:MAG: formylglycine-generating enzyme family protein [Candidatus Sabulitectum sp.]|nr:formylglycine-generating enzyme family protein [Candidatus Sabulitectum sp.]